MGVGTVLSQTQDGEECVIAYYSKTLGPAEKCYSLIQKQLSAVVKAVKCFRLYLYRQHLELQTEHLDMVSEELHRSDRTLYRIPKYVLNMILAC